MGVVSIALLLGSAELLLGFLAPVTFHRPFRKAGGAFIGLHRSGSVPGLEYELVPGAEIEVVDWGTTIHVNSEGLRGPEVQRAKPPGVWRLAALGDSFTFGHGVADDQTFVFHLSRLLDEVTAARPDGPRYEVLNFGVSGYSALDIEVVARHKAVLFDPDVLLYSYVLNDPEAHSNQPVHLKYHRTELWQRTHLSRWLAQFREERAIGHYGGWFQYLHRDPEHWATVERAFRGLKALGAEHGIPVVIVIMPILAARTWQGDENEDLYEQVSALGEEMGFLVLDIRKSIAKYHRDPRKLKLENDGHASDFGNDMFARAILHGLRAAYPGVYE